jgi:hypothetical protein
MTATADRVSYACVVAGRGSLTRSSHSSRESGLTAKPSILRRAWVGHSSGPRRNRGKTERCSIAPACENGPWNEAASTGLTPLSVVIWLVVEAE